MRIKVEFEVEIADIPHTEAQLDDYLKFSFGLIEKNIVKEKT